MDRRSESDPAFRSYPNLGEQFTAEQMLAWNKAPFQLRLMLWARVKALAHLWWGWRCLHGHRVWRVNKWWGLQTFKIFCECGKDF